MWREPFSAADASARGARGPAAGHVLEDEDGSGAHAVAPASRPTLGRRCGARRAGCGGRQDGRGRTDYRLSNLGGKKS